MGVQTLVIERSTTNISVVRDDQLLEATTRVTSEPIFGIVGIMNILGQNYLGVIERAAIVGTLNKAKIYKITTVNMVPFRVSNELGSHTTITALCLTNIFMFC